MNRIRVYVAGACGKVGMETVRTILTQNDMELVGVSDIRNQGEDIGTILGQAPVNIGISGPLEIERLKELRTDILVDFTNPQSVFLNAKLAIKADVVPVIGATGLDEQEISELEELAKENSVGVFIAPNFALGAILMMKFAMETAKYFPNVDIVEYHHDQKLDAPSGTALKTVEMISKNRKPMLQGHPNEYEKIPGARGGDMDGIHVHSIRLPGLIAHQEVIFGGYGQTLTIRHDALTRETYMPGVLLAIRKARNLKGLLVGLEHFLD
ncbi:4-hydroxy-tetrahydrodipicolinate reductase [Dehalobacter sp. DCM]|uniref:4-hydroxy-tetrahydrodipicolinate reductase n=1 Tax=Dehalobacter sp. DCM TaxID=2907827 RepID=UPI003081D808|nr:4-hydroxy-tetrahydrodipicolinate reductase [Dehalobacter sp. DCM]